MYPIMNNTQASLWNKFYEIARSHNFDIQKSIDFANAKLKQIIGE